MGEYNERDSNNDELTLHSHSRTRIELAILKWLHVHYTLCNPTCIEHYMRVMYLRYTDVFVLYHVLTDC